MAVQINITDISQAFLKQSVSSMPSLNLISTTSVNSAETRFQDTKNIPVYTAGTIVDWNEVTNNYETDNSSLPTVPVVFNRRKKFTFKVSDLMAGRVNIDEWINVQASSFARQVMQDILSVVTVANYNAAPAGLIGLATNASFGLTQLVTAKNVGDLANPVWNNGRSLWLASDYYNNFASTFATYITGGNVLSGGLLGSKMNIDLESFTIPVNGEKLVGFICDKSAIALGFLTTIPTHPGEIETEVVQDPSGLSFRISRHYSRAVQAEFITIEAIYGFGKGTGNLARVTSV